MVIQRLFLRAGRHGIAFLPAKGSAQACADLRFSSTAPVTIVEASFWRSLIPKPLRKENRDRLNAKMQKEWNPATFFIVMFLLIGSMSIQMLALRHQTERDMRQAVVKIAQLREVVKRIQNGENVDVEKALGTGDPQKEADWEEMLKAIEQDEASRKPAEPKKPKQLEAQAKSTSRAQSEFQPPVAKTRPTKMKAANFENFF